MRKHPFLSCASAFFIYLDRNSLEESGPNIVSSFNFDFVAHNDWRQLQNTADINHYICDCQLTPNRVVFYPPFEFIRL